MGAGASREEGIALLPCYRPYNTNAIRIFILIRTTAHGLPNKKIVFADLQGPKRHKPWPIQKFIRNS